LWGLGGCSWEGICWRAKAKITENVRGRNQAGSPAPCSGQAVPVFLLHILLDLVLGRRGYLHHTLAPALTAAGYLVEETWDYFLLPSSEEDPGMKTH